MLRTSQADSIGKERLGENATPLSQGTIEKGPKEKIPTVLTWSSCKRQVSLHEQKVTASRLETSKPAGRHRVQSSLRIALNSSRALNTPFLCEDGATASHQQVCSQRPAGRVPSRPCVLCWLLGHRQGAMWCLAFTQATKAWSNDKGCSKCWSSKNMYIFGLIQGTSIKGRLRRLGFLSRPCCSGTPG